MPKDLVILESPNKVAKVKSFLGSGFEVTATKGHIRDLPPKKIGVNIKKEFAPTYENYPEKKALIKSIIDKAKKCDTVYIMTDTDREGEYIGFHVVNLLPKSTKIKRAKTGSITKKAVQDAIKNATEMDQNLVDAAETRRILDRIVGWKCSFITKQATGGQSAGRVQSASLRIIAEREKEIRDFIPQEYWPIEATLEKENGERVTAFIKKPDKLKIKNEKSANDICDTFRKEKILISKYDVKDVSTKAYAPFTTSTLYQSASSTFGWGSKKTASVGQSLYEEGLITYIRTDSKFIVPEFIDGIRNDITSEYGSQYCPSKRNFYANKGNAQEAHEAIRVTDLSHTMTTGTDNGKLYTMIKKRTRASQTANMEQEKRVVEFTCKDYVLVSHGSQLKFDGWRRVWDYGSLEDSYLPEFKIGEKVKLIDLKTEQKFTTPPNRYNESSIVKKLETLGIGRPSTYASIIDTLLKRTYAEKQGKALHATDMGIRVSDFLIDANFCFIDLEFTSSLETDLDCIARGDCCKLEILQNFWERLKGDLENAKTIKDEAGKTDYPCGKCDGKLMLKHSKFGAFLTCEFRTNKDNPCDYKCDVGEDGSPKEKEIAEVKDSQFPCPNCGKNLIVRVNKKGGEYLGCRSWKEPKCKGFFSADDGEPIVFKKRTYKKKWKKGKKKQ
jgi:DNA topoisomerase-1